MVHSSLRTHDRYFVLPYSLLAVKSRANGYGPMVSDQRSARIAWL